MLIVGDKLISEEILQEEFVCNLSACKGACCIEGESGAPLNLEDIAEIERNLEGILPHLPPRSQESISREGFYEADSDGDLVTKCHDGAACVFVAMGKGGIAYCGIEAAHRAGNSDFLKPMSCHLYPIRVSQVSEYSALNYSRWSICSPACANGMALKVPIYRFLQGPLTRAFGAEWYEELAEIAEEYGSGE